MGDADGWNGGRRNDEAGYGRLLNVIANLQARLAAVERGAPLRSAGISASPDGLVIDSSLDVYGDVTSWGTDGDSFVRMAGGELLFRRLDLEIPGSMAAFEGETSGRTMLRIQPPRGEGIPFDDTGLYLEGPTAGQDGIATLTSGGELQLRGETDAFLRALGGQLVLSATGTVFLSADGSVSLTAGASALLTGAVVGFRSPRSGGGWSVDINSVGDRFNAVADDGFTLSTATDSHRIHVVGNDIGVDAPGRLYVAANLHATGNLSTGGTKPFKIVHPLDDTLALVHAATESPVAGVEYWGDGTIGDDGTVVVDLPDYFEALTAADHRGVQVTPYDIPVPLAASRVTGGQFTVAGPAGVAFSWLVKARRGDAAGQFETVLPRAEADIDPPVEADLQSAAVSAGDGQELHQ